MGNNLNIKPEAESQTKLKFRLVKSDEKEKWNDFVKDAAWFNLMQSYRWGKLKEELGWKSYRIAEYKKDDKFSSGAQVLYYPILNGLFSIGYIPRGPIIDPNEEDSLKSLFQKIHDLSKIERAIFLKIEPAWDYNEKNLELPLKFGFQTSEHRNQPQASIVIDLAQESDSILGQMQKSTRKNILLAKNKGIQVRKGSRRDLKEFYKLLVETSKRSNFSIRDFDYYKREWEVFAEINDAVMLLAEYNSKIIASRIVFKFGSHAAQFHSASAREYSSLKANDLLVWEAICWAKSHGCTNYDLWGIPDEIAELNYMGKEIPKQSSGGLWGVYNFKRGFGGNINGYIGAYDYVYSNLVYRISANGIFRRMSIEDVIAQFTR